MKEQTNSAGRQVLVPEKVGLKAVTKDGVDYEFTLNFDIDINNFASATKDRTALYKGKPEFKITPAIGETILKWCELGTENPDPPKPLISANQLDAAITRIRAGEDILQRLADTYKLSDEQYNQLKAAKP